MKRPEKIWKNCGFCEEGWQKALKKLYAIEDILGDDYGLDRLRELVEADRAGRCVVLLPGEDITPAAHTVPVLRYRTQRYERYEESGLNDNGEMLYVKRVFVDEKSYVMYCPSCGKRLCSRFTNFCPSCGAKMSGGTV